MLVVVLSICRTSTSLLYIYKDIKTMKNIIYSLLVISLFMGCKQRSAKMDSDLSNSVKNIDIINGLSELVPNLFLSDAASSMEIVALETSKKSLLNNNIGEIIVTKQYIFISDLTDNRVLRFSRDGKFMNKIGVIGQGPEEYVRMTRFTVDEANENIYILSSVQGIKVYKFDGSFNRIVTDGQKVSDLCYGANIGIISYGNDLFLSLHLPVIEQKDSLWSFIQTDTSFNIKSRFYNPSYVGREKEIFEHHAPSSGWVNYWMGGKASIDLYGERFEMKYADVDTIYQFDFTKNNFEPVYSLELGDRPDFEMSHLWIKDRKFFDYLWVYDFYDSKDYIYFSAAQSDKIYAICYDKESGKVKAMEKQGEIFERQFPGFSTPFLRMDTPFSLKNDLCGGGDFTVEYKSLGKYWVSTVLPSDLLEKIDVEALKKESVKDEKAKQQLLHVLGSVTEEDNPVLMIATLK